jgi:hypothetical protein
MLKLPCHTSLQDYLYSRSSLATSPEHPFDWKQPTEPVSPREQLNHKEAQQYTRQMYEAWAVVQGNIAKAQAL